MAQDLIPALQAQRVCPVAVECHGLRQDGVRRDERGDPGEALLLERPEQRAGAVPGRGRDGLGRRGAFPRRRVHHRTSFGTGPV
ncbi:hypothetical protein SUDANB176_03888 [Streptomyces sp. enrichment culture]